MREIYVSTDVETDGPLFGRHSMLSIGSAAYTADKELLGTFSANLETLTLAGSRPKQRFLDATGNDYFTQNLGHARFLLALA